MDVEMANAEYSEHKAGQYNAGNNTRFQPCDRISPMHKAERHYGRRLVMASRMYEGRGRHGQKSG